MADWAAKVRPGDKLALPSRTVNNAIDAARVERASRFNALGSPPEADRHSPAVIRILNDSGGDLSLGAVVKLGDPIVTVADNLEEWQAKPSFTGTVPDATDNLFAILVEPLPDGEIGRGCVAGVTPVQIDVSDSSHKYATPTASDATKLTSATSGPALILWKESGTGTKWGLVDLVAVTDLSSGGTITGPLNIGPNVTINDLGGNTWNFGSPSLTTSVANWYFPVTIYLGCWTWSSAAPPAPTEALTEDATSSSWNGATGNYYAKYTYNSSNGGTESAASPESLQFALTFGFFAPTFTVPALPDGVSSWNLYLTPVDGATDTETLQVTGLTALTYTYVGPYVAGAAPPAAPSETVPPSCLQLPVVYEEPIDDGDYGSIRVMPKVSIVGGLALGLFIYSPSSTNKWSKTAQVDQQEHITKKWTFDLSLRLPSTPPPYPPEDGDLWFSPDNELYWWCADDDEFRAIAFKSTQLIEGIVDSWPLDDFAPGPWHSKINPTDSVRDLVEANGSYGSGYSDNGASPAFDTITAGVTINSGNTTAPLAYAVAVVAPPAGLTYTGMAASFEMRASTWGTVSAFNVPTVCIWAGLFLELDPASPGPGMRLRLKYNGTYYTFASFNLQTETLYLISASYDPATQTAVVSVNGTPESFTGVAPSVSAWPYFAVLQNQLGGVLAGAASGAEVTFANFNVWQRSLTTAEHTALWHNGTPLQYPFTGALSVDQGGTGDDLSGSGGTGSVITQPTAGGAFASGPLKQNEDSPIGRIKGYETTP